MKLIIGNWKLHFNSAESSALAKEITAGNTGSNSFGVAPVFTSLEAVCSVSNGLRVYAQNCHWENEGAFTGEIAPNVLKSLGCTGVIIGHSERRHMFGESDDVVNKKALAALREGLQVIICVGETLGERDAGDAEKTVRRQIDLALSGISSSEIDNLVIAYEPVWAIGTGKTATPAIAQSMHHTIKDLLIAWNHKAKSIPVIYGGSVKPANCDALLSQPAIDGALVGGASLKAETFLPIVNFSQVAK